MTKYTVRDLQRSYIDIIRLAWLQKINQSFAGNY